MSERFIHPPDGALPQGCEEPLVFLAGPIQGAPDWQTSAAEYLLENHASLYVASPRRESIDTSFDYEAQVNWEKTFLRRAALIGTIAFWFAAQDNNLPYEQGRAYAQTSRIEIGRVFGWADKSTQMNISVGFEPGYQGGSRRYIEAMCKEKGVPVHHSLDSLLNEVITELG